MELTKKYRLIIGHNPSRDYDTFMFNNKIEVKRFMEHIASTEEFLYELYELSYAWDLSTGVITISERRVTSW